MRGFVCTLFTTQFVQLALTVQTAHSAVVHIVAMRFLQAERDVSAMELVSLDARLDGVVTIVILVHTTQHCSLMSLMFQNSTGSYRSLCIRLFDPFDLVVTLTLPC